MTSTRADAGDANPLRIVLASASPARLATLRRAGIDPEVIVSGADETIAAGLDVAAAVAELARRKAEAVHARIACKAPTLIIGCDSLLEFNGQAHGKPGDEATVIDRWRQLRGKSGTLHTGHHLILDDGTETRTANQTASTIVHFADAGDAEIAAYAATGEPEQVAGGFTLDGLGGPLIAGIEGDPHAVVGISLPLLRTKLRELGLAWPGFAPPA